MLAAMIAATATVAAMPSEPTDREVGAAMDTAVATCEQWILDPATWADSFARFPAKGGLAARGLISQPSVPDIALPPPEFRQALHYWRVPVGAGGIYVSASDQVPVCHIAGGGTVDFQPGVDETQSSASFLKRWKAIRTETKDDIVSTHYENVLDAKLSMVLSRPSGAGGRTDRVQVLATAQYDIGK